MTEIKGVTGGVLAQAMGIFTGIINVGNILEGVILAFLGGVFGYLGSKAVKYVERKFIKRNSKPGNPDQTIH